MTYPYPIISLEPSTSVSLLEGARQGSAESWERIVRLYGPIIYTWARRCRRQPADAADIVQEVLADAAKGLKSYSGNTSGATFRGWLWTITRRRLADQTRAWSKRPQAADQEMLAQIAISDSRPSDPPTDASCDRRSILASALAGLHRRFNPETLEAFRRTVLNSEEPDAVAADLGISRWSVYKAKSRVLQRLRCDLEGLIDAE